MAPIPQTEVHLIKALQAGQKSAFTTLYDAYSPALFGVLIRLVSDQSTAEDLLQDTFIKIWTNVHRYDPSQGRLFTWLITITKNVAMDELRARKTQQKAKTYIKYQTDQRIYIPATDAIGHQSLFELVAPKYRQILELTSRGYTKEEIAIKFKLPVGTVKTRYRAAIQELKRIFSQDIYQYTS